MDLAEAWNAQYIDVRYRLWKSDPASVSRDWQFFFQGFELAEKGAATPDSFSIDDAALRQSRVERLIHRYRDIGHLKSCLDPLAPCSFLHPLLAPEAFDLTEGDLDETVFTRHFSDTGKAPVRRIIEALNETYCRTIGVEYMHMQDPEERRWIQEKLESDRNQPNLDRTSKLRVLNKICQAVNFEQFLNKKYKAQTRFSLEGAEAVIVMLDALLLRASELGCREIILGMAHRGRLNVQTNILQKPYAEIFGEFESCYDPGSLIGSGDVKYHNGYLGDVEDATGRRMRIFLVNNPSHLESVNPVVEGFARARQDLTVKEGKSRILPVLIHGDGAFAGQGIVAETLNLSQLKGYTTGGTVHIVINNQIGYTTLPEDARSTRYSTDVAKMLMIPIFHVHGEDPEAVVHVVRLAVEYRSTFKKDVVVDVVCYRRYGHNEGDEPYYTQPQMVERIKSRPSLNLIYGEKLMAEGLVTREEIQAIENRIDTCLETAFQEVIGSACPFPTPRFYENWEGFHGDYGRNVLETGVKQKRLKELSRKLCRIPENFSVHPKLQSILKKRQDAVESGQGLDWANAEALAFASILAEGLPVRLSGQDCGRGTFSQRHSVLVDMRSEGKYIPFNHLGKDQADFAVYDSMLAEAGVLGFEYGYSTAQPRGLVLWEAQFGDFANNAQAVIDLYIASGESKWQRLSGLVLLLPHGLEGLGPEHSSARPERFLQLCAGNNLQICNPTTPAQYFHLLRRQAKSVFRKPLVVLTPKGLLRHKQAVSSLHELSAGAFVEVMEDDAILPADTTRILLCSGKIYYDLFERRERLGDKTIALVRIEQLYPLPESPIAALMEKYPKAGLWAWVQEEPENMGPWPFLQPRLERLVDGPVAFIGRPPSASPATGFPGVYRQQQAAILDQALGTDHQ